MNTNTRGSSSVDGGGIARIPARGVRWGALAAAVALITVQVGATSTATAAAPTVKASVGTPTSASPNALTDVTPLLTAAVEADRALAAQRAAVLATVSGDSATATEATTAAGERISEAMSALDAAIPYGVSGKLRDAVLKLHSDLFARVWNQRFQITGFVYHRVPQPEFNGEDALGALLARLDTAGALAQGAAANLDAVRAAALRSAPVRFAARDSVRGMETRVQLEAADGVVFGCADQGIAPAVWSGHHLVLTWTATSKTQRSGVLTTPGRAGKATFTVSAPFGSWDFVMVDLCAVTSQLN